MPTTTVTAASQLSPEAEALWLRFVAQLGHDPVERFYESFHFYDEQTVADHLAELVTCGQKRATAGLLWTYEAESKALPPLGSLSIVTRWSGAPVCIIATTSVETVPFDRVSAEFAAIEGEGDGSLAFWRRVHADYFLRECARIGKVFAPDVPVVCERFEVVFP